MYSINKKGASILLSYIEQHGIKHGIDYLIKMTNEMKNKGVKFAAEIVKPFAEDDHINKNATQN